MATPAAYDLTVDATETIEGRPFTDPERSLEDRRWMRTMLARERELARAWAADADPPPSASVLDHIDGRRHWLAVPSVPNLLRAADITVVGFFGHFRDGVDCSVLFEL